MITCALIIPTFNGAHKITHALDSVLKQSQLPDEIIIVIDGSNDRTDEVLEPYSSNPIVKMIRQKNGGRSVSRNAGAAAAKSDILFFLDDDMRLESNAVEKHLQFHTEFKDAILVGAQIEQYEVLQNNIQQYKADKSRIWHAQIATKRQQITFPYITAAHVSMPCTVFKFLQGFDEKLTDAEDYLMAIMAIEKNVALYFDPTIIGWHDDFITVDSYVQRMKQYRKAQLNLEKWYPDLMKKYNFRKKNTPQGIKKITYQVLKSNLFLKFVETKTYGLLPKWFRLKLTDMILDCHGN